MDEVPAGARHHRCLDRPGRIREGAREERDRRGPRRAARPVRGRRAAHPPIRSGGDLLVAVQVRGRLPLDPARRRRRRASARDAPLRVRRQPDRDRRRPHDRQRRAPRRRGHLAPARGLRGPRGGAPDLLRDRARDRHLSLDDPLRRGPLHAGEEGRAGAGRADPVQVPQGLHRRPPLRRRREARPRSPRSRRPRSGRSTPTPAPVWPSRARSCSTRRTRTSRSS